MRQLALLILDHIYVTRIPSEKAVTDVRQELLYFYTKDASDKIKPIGRLLARLKLANDFGLARVRRKRDKEHRLSEITYDRYKILK